MSNGGKILETGGIFGDREKNFKLLFQKKLKLRKKILKILKILEIRDNEKYGIIKNMGGGVGMGK